MKHLLLLIALFFATPAFSQSNAAALDYVNRNYKLVYPTATKPIVFNAISRPDEILLDGIGQILARGGNIGPKGVAAEGKEPASLYPVAAYTLTRLSNDQMGEKYYEFDRANLNTFAGRIYLALLRDNPLPSTPVTNCNAAVNSAVNAALDKVDTAVKASRP